LLFNGERPQVLQQGRASGEFKIGLIGNDVPPVVHVEDRRYGISAELPGCILRPEDHNGADNEEHERHSGQESAGSTKVEAPEVHPSGTIHFFQDQCCDQESTQDKEDINPEKSTRQCTPACVVEKNSDNCDGA
jgi:hypothetical protein